MSCVSSELIDDAAAEKRGSKGLKLFMWKRKSKQQQEEKADGKEEAAGESALEEPAAVAPAVPGAETEDVSVAAPEVQQPAAAAPEPKTEAKAEKEVVSAPGEAARQDIGVPETAGTTGVKAAAPISPPISLTYEPAQDDERPEILRPQTAPRDAAATGGLSVMQNIQPITSPRADSKLKTWFRDRLIRRTSEPQPLYPHQPGPEYNNDSETVFTGGAALTGRAEPRGAALSSHPVSTEDIESEHGENWGAGKSSTEDAVDNQTGQNGDSNGMGKRHRLRRSLLKTVSRNSQELKTNGVDHKPKSPEAVPSTELQGLRNSAAEQGLPAPPVLGDTRRESRFSEDL